MLLPRGDEYNDAIQNPRIVFSDADLKNSSVETTPLGLPKPYSGGFTITYRLLNAQKGWAVRCFHRDIQDLQQRYHAIGDFISKSQSPYFVEAKYLEDGIKIRGKGYPIIKMAWLEGEPLNIYLNKIFTQKVKIERILNDFLNLISELERFGIAHGDLQHGNIIVKNEKLYLIDYDGMYFPELSSLKTNEIGHVNYQHPKRSATHYNPNIDRFSAIIIYTGLKAISINPDLWRKYDNSENILFRSQDFANLQSSSLIHDLLVIPEVKPLVERLIGCCHMEFDKIPSLKDFLFGNFVYNKSAIGTIKITRSQYEVINAAQKGSLLEHFGEKIEVVGRISGHYSGTTSYETPFMFLNFGRFPNQTFTLVIWQEGIASLIAKGMSPMSLVGKYVSITGVIGSYGGNPQMIIELPTQIQILSGETEINERLKYKPSTPSSPPMQIKKIEDNEKRVFDQLYRNTPVYVPPKPIISSKPAPSTNISKPNMQNKSGNSGCTVVIAILGAIIVGAVTESFGGIVAGIFLGGIIGSFVAKS